MMRLNGWGCVRMAGWACGLFAALGCCSEGDVVRVLMRHLLGCAVPQFSSQLKKIAVLSVGLVDMRVWGVKNE